MKLSKTEYRTIHLWVERRLGKPSRCEHCEDTSNRRYHWANVSGGYKRDVKDWKRLCPPCHAVFDGKTGICKKGHVITSENSYYKPGGRLCKKCQLDYGRSYYHRKYKAILLAKRVAV